MPCSRIQRQRARATSARCRSAACKLFLKVISYRPKSDKAHCSFTSISFKVRSGRRSRPISAPGCASNREKLPWRGDPALVPSCTHLTAELTPTSKRLSVPRRDAPSISTGSITRSRRSPEQDSSIAHPEKENQCTNTRSSITLWKPLRFKSDGSRIPHSGTRSLCRSRVLTAFPRGPIPDIKDPAMPVRPNGASLLAIWGNGRSCRITVTTTSMVSASGKASAQTLHGGGVHIATCAAGCESQIMALDGLRGE
jgi:hypothetical protein